MFEKGIKKRRYRDRFQCCGSDEPERKWRYFALGKEKRVPGVVDIVCIGTYPNYGVGYAPMGQFLIVEVKRHIFRLSLVLSLLFVLFVDTFQTIFGASFISYYCAAVLKMCKKAVLMAA